MSKKGTYLGGGTIVRGGSDWFGGLKGEAKQKRERALQKRLKREASKRLKASPIAGWKRKGKP
jgi:hypothetical protein